MKLHKKGLITLFEMAFILLLFFGTLAFFTYSPIKKDTQDHRLAVESFADVLYKNDSFRSIVHNENLGGASLTQNWTPIESLLNTSFNSYEVVLRGPPGNPNVKTVFACNKTYGKVITQRVFSGNDTSGNNYAFRRLTLGVCY